MNYNKYFPIDEYYKKIVVPINPNRYRTKSDKMFVCPVHNDHDPSLGIIRSKDGDICHCFGCNFWGNVVELHQRVSKRHFKKYLSEEEAVRDLCKIFKVDFEELPKEDLNSNINRGTRQELELEKSMERFDIGDFQRLLYEGKKKKKSIGYFNAVIMTMVDSCKE